MEQKYKVNDEVEISFMGTITGVSIKEGKIVYEITDLGADYPLPFAVGIRESNIFPLPTEKTLDK